MQNVSYGDRNAFTGLSSVTVYIFTYILNLFLALILKFYLTISHGKYGGQRLYNYLIKGLLFNAILSITM